MTRDPERESPLSGLDADLHSFVAALRCDLEDRLKTAGFAPSNANLEFDESDDEGAHPLPLEAWPTLAQHDPELALFAADLRGLLDQRVAGHEVPLPVPVRAPVLKLVAAPLVNRQSSWRRYALACTTALAACAMMVAGAIQWRLEQVGQLNEASQAAQHLDPDEAIQAAAPAQRGTFPERTPSTRDDDTVATALVPLVEPVLQVSKPPVGGTALSPRRFDTSTTSETLSQRARESWQAGDLVTATRLLRQVIARDRASDHASDHDSEAAEAAYADLFALARQQGPRARQVKIWREYLRDFPHGRYAQDARAGLCHNADDGKAQACWRDYLHHHPQGTHRASAESALGLPSRE